jgi:hypothetical protein
MSLRRIAIFSMLLVLPATMHADVPQDLDLEVYDLVLLPLLTPPVVGAHGQNSVHSSRSRTRQTPLWRSPGFAINAMAAPACRLAAAITS